MINLYVCTPFAERQYAHSPILRKGLRNLLDTALPSGTLAQQGKTVKYQHLFRSLYQFQGRLPGTQTPS